MSTLFARVLRFCRSVLGTAQTIEQQQLFDRRNAYRHDRLQQAALKLGNALSYAQVAPDVLRTTPVYRRCAEIITLLAPMDLDGAGYVRVGGPHDGGYVMVDCLDPGSIDAAFGFGIGTDSSWDQAIAGRGIDVFLFDHTVATLPALGPRCRAFPFGLTGTRKAPSLRTLEELLAEHGHAGSQHLIMKMDIENSEWDVLNQVSSRVLDQFSQIVIEFHRLTTVVHRADQFAEAVAALNKINLTHQCVHVHGNCTSLPIWIGPLVLPDILEVTYLRRRDWIGRLSPCRRQFPTELDEPSHGRSADIYLGTFSVPQ